MISELVKNAIKNIQGGTDLDVNNIKPLKKELKKRSIPNAEIELLTYCMDELMHKKGDIRIRVFHLIDHIFCRSLSFRNIFNSSHFRNLCKIAKIENCSQINNKNNLEIDSKFKKIVIESIFSWNEEYGASHPPLQAITRYFTESLFMNNNTINSNNSSINNISSSNNNNNNNSNSYNRGSNKRDHESISTSNHSNGDSNNIAIADNNNETSLTQDYEAALKEIQDAVLALEQYFKLLFPIIEEETTNTDTITNTTSSSSSSSSSDARVATHTDVEWEDDDDSDNDEEKDENENENRVDSSKQSGIIASSSSSSSSSLDEFVRDYGLGSVAFSIEIPISLSATDIKSADNDLLLELIMEVSKHLSRHVLPRVKKVLERYKEDSSNGTGNEEGKRREKSRSKQKKRKKTNEDDKDKVVSDEEKTLVESIQHAEELLETKCKPLFLSSSFSSSF